MSIRKTNLVPDEYYHVYNRGNSKQVIFIDKEDYFRFSMLLYICNSSIPVHISNTNSDRDTKAVFDIQLATNTKLVAIGAYVLMSNHFHLLLTPLIEGGLSLFMQKVSTAYSMYFNKKYVRSGGLFEGKFKAEHISSDRYMKYLFSYIHLNPIKQIDPTWKDSGLQNKQEAIDFLEQFPYSSYYDYLGNVRPENKILNIQKFPSYFPNPKDFTKEIIFWLSYPSRQDLDIKVLP
jgi:putative transposase